MKKPDIPVDEDLRLKKLYEYSLLDTLHEEEFVKLQNGFKHLWYAYFADFINRLGAAMVQVKYWLGFT